MYNYIYICRLKDVYLLIISIIIIIERCLNIAGGGDFYKLRRRGKAYFEVKLCVFARMCLVCVSVSVCA